MNATELAKLRREEERLLQRLAEIRNQLRAKEGKVPAGGLRLPGYPDEVQPRG